MRGGASMVWGVAALVAVVAMAKPGAAQATDQWQVHLANGDYVYEITHKALHASP